MPRHNWSHNKICLYNKKLEFQTKTYITKKNINNYCLFIHPGENKIFSAVQEKHLGVNKRNKTQRTSTEKNSEKETFRKHLLFIHIFTQILQ